MGTNRNTLRLYARQARKHWVLFMLAAIFFPVMALFLDTLLPYFLSLAIGDLANNNSKDVTFHLIMAGVFGGAGVLANIVAFNALLYHESRVRTDLYNATFSGLLHKDFAFFVNEKVGALTSRFIDFVRAHVMLQDLIVIRTLGFLLSLVVSLWIVASHAPLMAIILGVLIAILFVEMWISIHLRQPYRRTRKKIIADIHGSIADGMTNNLIVKTFAGEKAEQKHLNADLHTFYKAYTKDLTIMGIDGNIRIFLTVITQVAGIAVAAYLIFNGQLELAIAIFALTYLQRIATQIFSLGEVIQGYEQVFLDAAPMSDILSTPTTVNDKPGAINIKSVDPVIELRNVSYHYSDKAENVLNDIDLIIPAGQKVGLVGHSGAGKTTFTHLLLRFDDVSEGSITIGGHDLRDLTQESLRHQIAYVPQEPMLFHRTLRENIAYGRPNATEKEILEAARKANALEFIKKLPDGINTLVGERGVKLSGGQRQRIAIARAILKDAPILILDEATSALDSESEKLIQDALRELMKGRTSIVIAHRLSTIAKLDRIIVLDDGKIIEDGSHTELLAQNGTYAKLWAHQSGGFIEE